MAKVYPFKAIRPSREKVNLVSSRSYESYNQDELNAILEYNPYSFLHILNPSYKFQEEISVSERFSMVRNRFLDFKDKNVFLEEEKECYYLYQTENATQSFYGLIAASHTDDYDNELIKKHENTLEQREKLFTKYLKSVGFNAEPVLLTYKDDEKINDVLTEKLATRPEYEFTSQNKNIHRLWVINTDKDIKVIKDSFSKINALYIADGHHRSASSNLLSKQMKSENPLHKGNENYNFCLSFLIAEEQLNILEFNRLIKDIDITKKELLLKLDKSFRIENKGSYEFKPSQKHEFMMYFEGEFYALYPREKFKHNNNSLDDLDTQILYDLILNPILGITDERNDKRISYINGKEGVLSLKNKVDTNEFVLGFALFPPTFSQVKSIADNNLTMPPKSTYIEPKLRSGLIIMEF